MITTKRPFLPVGETKKNEPCKGETMPQTQLTHQSLTLTAYLHPSHRLLDAQLRVIGAYRWLTVDRIVAQVHGRLYTGKVVPHS